jgi:hypothetical protein
VRHATIRRPLAALVAVAALAVAIVSGAAAPAGAQPPDPTWPADAAAGARWLAYQLSDEGSIDGWDGQPSASNTAQTALALAAAGKQAASFDAAVGWLEDNVEALVAPDGTDNPGGMGYALLVADAAGLDATDFGGVDLVERLEATMGDDGMFGGAVEGYDPTYSAVYNQSLAVIGLFAHDVVAEPISVHWLVEQQCEAPESPEAAVGGWQSYRADPAVEPCVAPDPVNFVGPDTNSSAMALQTLVGIGVAPEDSTIRTTGVDFLQRAQGPDGGFPFVTGAGVDPNSTALVIQAIVAVGDDPVAEPWAVDGLDPVSSLASWQVLGYCGLEVEGSFEAPFSGGFPDQLATQQAVWGAAGTPFPLGEASFAPDDLAPADVAAFGQPLQATVTWAVPPDAAEPVTGYEVWDGDDLAVVAGPDLCSVAVIGLEAGSTHTFTVIARYEDGPSPASAPSDEVVILPAEETFDDVPPSQAFAPEINWAIVEGVANGYPDGSFLPAAEVSRQATAAFLYRFAGEPEFEAPEVPTFIDVPVDHAFYQEIEWLVATGITTGYPDDTFLPADDVSRQAMSAFLSRFAAACGCEPPFDPPADPTFIDVPTDQGFYDEIEWLAASGISTGYPDDTFRPVDAVTRQAMVAFLYRYTTVLPVFAPPVLLPA